MFKLEMSEDSDKGTRGSPADPAMSALSGRGHPGSPGPRCHMSDGGGACFVAFCLRELGSRGQVVGVMVCESLQMQCWRDGEWLWNGF